MKNGGETLFLTYTINGERKYEYLRLHIKPGTDALTKRQNKATMEAAKTIQATRIMEIQQGKANIKKNQSTDLVTYFNSYIEKHDTSENYKETMRAALKHWITVFGKSKTIESINKEDMLKFSRYLKRNLKESSGAHYYNIIGTVFQSAWRDGLIERNPTKILDKNERPKPKQAEREYLTMEELQILAETNCRDKNLKQAFMFSCFTGLRLSDIITLDWRMIQGDTIVKRMIKTKELIRIPLSANAREWLPKKNYGLIFILKSERQIGRDLSRWMKDAGIDKRITFHCARHTFACLLLTYGSDIYTTSKLLGHANVATTQIYAHMVDEKRKQAIDNIPGLKK